MRRPHANPSRFEQDEELPADEEGMSQASRLLNQADPQATIHAADDAALAASVLLCCRAMPDPQIDLPEGSSWLRGLHARAASS